MAYNNNIISIYIKIFVVCPSVRPSVMDVGMAITNLCKLSYAFQLSQKWPQSFLAAGRDTQRCRLREGCRACRRTSDEQEHKIIWCAGPEQDTIFHLRVTAC